jgi:hypothetical protein
MKNWICFLFVLAACSGGGNRDTDDDIALPPTAATLLTPGKDTTCVPGAVVTDSTTMVTFTWKAGEHADGYVVTVRNLISLVEERQSITATHAELVLKRNTPYSWFVIAKSSDIADTAVSEKWKFYVPAAATSTYAPFPAALLAPGLGAVVSGAKVKLQWMGSDVDNDIAAYDVYLGTTSTPGLLQSGVTGMSLADVIVTAGTTYYWKVVTKDGAGNVSTSELYTFRVS